MPAEKHKAMGQRPSSGPSEQQTNHATPEDYRADDKKRKADAEAKEMEEESQDLDDDDPITQNVGSPDEEDSDYGPSPTPKKRMVNAACYFCSRVLVKRGDIRNVFRCGHCYLCMDHIKTLMPKCCPECGLTSVTSRFKRDCGQYMPKSDATPAHTGRRCIQCNVVVDDPTEHLKTKHNWDLSGESQMEQMNALDKEMTEIMARHSAILTEYLGIKKLYDAREGLGQKILGLSFV